MKDKLTKIVFNIVGQDQLILDRIRIRGIRIKNTTIGPITLVLMILLILILVSPIYLIDVLRLRDIISLATYETIFGLYILLIFLTSLTVLIYALVKLFIKK